ncbi:MAG: hypothetical protein K0R18_2031 [Bacillales bacterium]|nr:hypothetical protein [Bacillales bacterium]
MKLLLRGFHYKGCLNTKEAFSDSNIKKFNIGEFIGNYVAIYRKFI